MEDVEELLIEILVRLPPICLPRFQLVSKRWFSIISTRLHTRRLPAAVTGLFFAQRSRTHPIPGPLFVPLKGGPDEHTQHKLAYRLNGLSGGGPIVSLHSCNGLLCVWSLDENRSDSFHVFNPTTNQRRRISHPFPLAKKTRYEISAINLAFDPSKSHHYNLVCVYKYTPRKPSYIKTIGFSVFFSESRVWRKSHERLSIAFSFRNRPGAFLNGAIHRYAFGNKFLCFDVENAQLRPMPPGPLEKSRRCIYFGECGGHLNFVEHRDHTSKLLNVYEMENDYSRWVSKYQVDLTYIQTKFFPNEFPVLADYGNSTIGISIHLFLVDEKGKEALVISFPGKIILYHLHNMSITQLTVWPEIFNYGIVYPGHDDLVASLGRHSTCKYIETLAYI